MVLDVKWVCSKKSDDAYKAKLVVRGFKQTNVIDDISSRGKVSFALKKAIVWAYFWLFSGNSWHFFVPRADIRSSSKNANVKNFVFLLLPVCPNYRTDGCSNGIFKWRNKLGGIYRST